MAFANDPVWGGWAFPIQDPAVREQAEIEPLLRELVGSHSGAFLECLDLFEITHPKDEPHYYLSLLVTHDDYRGQCVGMQLLRENLQLIDRESMPCYLESTNPANVARYESVGFCPVGSFTLPAAGGSA